MAQQEYADWRFWQKVNLKGPIPEKRPELGPCWQWIGAKKAAGYGHIYMNGKLAIAHRWIYQRHVGPISPGYEIDHLCENRSCVNYESHLEQVTVQENRRRRVLAKTHCVNGHKYTPENTYSWTDADGYLCRFCRTCRNEASNRRYQLKSKKPHTNQ